MNAPAPLSVLLLARDETADLEALLPALAFAAEAVVVWDPRGDAATRAAAERLGARVHAHEWAGFGPQRAFALAQCTQPWVLWIDADERLDTVARAAIEALVRDPAAGAGAATLERATWFLGRRIRFCGWRRERLVRLFRRDGARFDDAPVHERVTTTGPAVALPGTLEHHSYRTWDDCVTKMHRYGEAGAQKAFAAGRRAGTLDPLVRPPLRFLRQYVLQLGFLDGWRGFVLCRFAAAQVRIKYARLAELSRAEAAR